MKVTIIYLIEGDYQNYYRAYLQVGDDKFMSIGHHTVEEWKEILQHDLKGIPIKDR